MSVFSKKKEKLAELVMTIFSVKKLEGVKYYYSKITKIDDNSIFFKKGQIDKQNKFIRIAKPQAGGYIVISEKDFLLMYMEELLFDETSSNEVKLEIVEAVPTTRKARLLKRFSKKM